MLHIPILRHGKPYESVDQVEIVHHATGEPVARVSQANAGLISRDIARMDFDVLEQFKVAELVAMCKKAGEWFISGTVPVGNESQSFDDYVRQLSATTGMPTSYCRANAQEDLPRAGRDGCYSGGADPRFRFVDPRPRLWERRRADALVVPRGAGVRGRAAQQLAGRAFAVGAGGGAQDANRPEAGTGGAVDAVADHRVAGGGRVPAGSLWLLSHRPRRGGHAAPIGRPLHALRRCLHDQGLVQGPARRAARPRVQQGDPGRRCGQ